MKLFYGQSGRFSAYLALGLFVLASGMMLVQLLDRTPETTVPSVPESTPSQAYTDTTTSNDTTTDEQETPAPTGSASATVRTGPNEMRSHRTAYERPDIPHGPITVEECERRKEDSQFFVDPTNQAIKIERDLRERGEESTAALLRHIACEPLAVWLMGSAGIERTEAKIAEVLSDTEETGDIPVFVLYNQPFHRAPGWASGYDPDAYHAWVEAISAAIGPREAWVILEPDALPTAVGYDTAGRQEQLGELGRAVDILGANPNTRVYIDAGHSHWLSVSEAIALLERANVRSARGFSLNVSNYRTVEDELAYGRAVAAAFPDTHFIIDTSRNGTGPNSDAEWCNAPGRGIGITPQLAPKEPVLDAYLWVKPPGESDGTCNGGPPAGKFWLEYALELIQNADRE